MKAIQLLLFVCFVNSVRATNYYFSSTSGNDSRTSTQAKSSSTPWKTINKLNSFFSSLKPGDSVLFKRGETFYGSIIVNKSGSSTSPIVIGAYGSGNKPIITSLVTLTSWVSKGGGIWESYNSSLSTKVNTVLLNGAPQVLGRFPNNTASHNGYLSFESHVGTTSITDNQLTSGTNWTGAELVIRTRRWVLDRNVITSHSGTKISYATSSIYEPYDNYGYFIQNSIKALDKFGEWYYSPSTKKMSIYFGSSNPSSYSIQASTITNLITSNDFDNIVFSNLNLKGANNAAVNITYGSNISISSCDIWFSGTTGVYANYHDNLKVENCIISNSNNNGIDLGYGGNYAILRNNQILNTATNEGMGLGGDGKGVAILSYGKGNIIEFNRIINTGYLGIHFDGDNVRISNNLIDSFCTTKDDGAGIYTVNSAGVANTGRKIQGNIIMNGLGAGEGTSNSIYLPAEGVYIDNNASNIDISNNTIANCKNNGFYFHNAYKLTVRNNTVYNNTTQLSAIQDPDSDPIRNNVIASNIFFSKLGSQMVSALKTSENDISLFGKFDSNYYARPLDDRIDIYNTYVKSTSTRVTQRFELEGWKDKYNKDATSKRTAKQIAPYKVSSLVGSNKVSNGSFSSNVDAVSFSSCTISFSKSGQLDGGYLQVVPSSRNAAVYMTIGGITSGKKYILKYSVRGSVDSSSVIGAYLRQGLSPYSNVTPTQYRKVDKTRSDNEMIFTATSTESLATVVFSVDDETKYYLDNIQVYEANATITNPDDSMKFVYNSTNANKTITLSGSYVDVKNTKYTNSIVLKPYASAVLIKSSGTAVAANVAPTIKITKPVVNMVYNSLATIDMEAVATDPDGTITKVEFHNDTRLLGTEYKAPYTWSSKNVPAGNYHIYAVATDDDGATTTSAKIAISVKSVAGSPVVVMTSPVIDATYNASATVNLSATATDAGGSIEKVEFYNGSTLLTTEYKVPYSWSWTKVPEGTYYLSARATDNSGNVTNSASIPISVKSQTLAFRPGNESLSISDSNSIEESNSQNSIEVSKPFGFKIFPNPAKNFMQVYFDGISSNQKAEMIIQTMSGSILRRSAILISGKQIEVDISSLSTGVYMLSVVGNKFSINKQFVKVQ